MWLRCCRATRASNPFTKKVREAVAQSLRQQAWITACVQAMQLLAGRWEVEGVDLDSAGLTLLQ